MPTYIFRNPETGEVKEIFQKMKALHKYKDKGVQWERVWMSPNAAITDNLISADTTCEEFCGKTSEKNYNLGEMWDLSAQLSEKRKQARGTDHVKEKTKKAYTKKCKGKKHPHAND